MGKNFRVWKTTERVLRTNETTITIINVKYKTTIEFKDPNECLRKFIELRKDYEDAWRFKGPGVYRDGTKL
jgi:hypothetical protein